MDFDLSDEQRLLVEAVRAFVRKEVIPAERTIDTTGVIPESVLRKAKEAGYFGLTIGPEHGGLGVSAVDYALVVMEFARGHQAFSALLAVANGIGAMSISRDGTEQQRRRYLPRLATGEIIAAFALSEPEAGSDAANIQTTATAKDDRYLLNGTKHFISCADLADLFVVFAVTDRARRANGGITAFLVEKGAAGFALGAAQQTMGGLVLHELVFENCEVPAENVLGSVGRGFATAMRTLDFQRMALCASCVGASERLLAMSRDYAKSRVQFGKSIGEFQAVQLMLADMAVDIAAARALVLETAWRVDRGQRVSLQAAATKLFGSEMVGRVADRAVQIHGGVGYATDSPVERIYRGVRGYRIFGGTSEILRLLIARELLKD